MKELNFAQDYLLNQKQSQVCGLPVCILTPPTSKPIDWQDIVGGKPVEFKELTLWKNDCPENKGFLFFLSICKMLSEKSTRGPRREPPKDFPSEDKCV